MRNRIIYLVVGFMQILSVMLSATASAQPRCIVTSYYNMGDNEAFNHIQGILQDSNGMIWITSWGGIHYFDGREFSSSTTGSHSNADASSGIYPPPPGERWQLADRVTDTTITDRYGIRWHIDSTGRVFTVDPTGRETVAAGLPEFKGYRGCFVDNQNNVWIMCSNELHKLVFSTYRLHYLKESIGEAVRCMFTLTNGQHWVCLRESGTVLVYDSDFQLAGYLTREGKISPVKASFGAAVYSMAETADGTLWLGTRRDGLFKLVKDGTDTYTVSGISRGDPACSNIYDIAIDGKGRLWLAMFDGGIGMIERDATSITRLPDFDSRQFSRVRDIATLRDTLVVASSGALAVADISGSPESISFTYHKAERNEPSSLGSSLIDYVYFDSRHRLWVCTENSGLYMCTSSSLLSDRLSFRNFGKDYGLPSTAYCITESAGTLILTSIHSLSLISSDGSCGDVGIETLDKDYFGKQVDLTEIPPLTIDRDRWIIATASGALLYAPENPAPGVPGPKIVITSLATGSRTYDYNDIPREIILQPAERSVRIRFASLDYTFPQAAKYCCRITHGTDTTTHLAQGNTLDLNNLTPGKYDIEIFSTGALTSPDDRCSVFLTLDIPPKFSETLWFKPIILVSAITLIVLIVLTWLYVRRITKKHAEITGAYLSLIGKQNRAHDMVINSLDVTTRQDEFVRKLSAYISDNISDSTLKVENMADHMAMSASTLTRLTKSVMGITPGEFLSKARIRKAMIHLKNDPTLQIAEIAQLCGYSDPKYFSRCFRAETGMSPSQYKNNPPQIKSTDAPTLSNLNYRRHLPFTNYLF